MKTPPRLRVARPSSNFERLLPFYRDGLGFEVIGGFEDHNGWDGIMLGHPGWPYHLEFTRHHDGEVAPRAPSPDNLLVFYIEDATEWRAALTRMFDAGLAQVSSVNPYWDAHGATFEDPDGYRVVLYHGSWSR
jgi:catechol 2,3-dioxygenase-like lactoylglutathione lyase family enzyme